LNPRHPPWQGEALPLSYSRDNKARIAWQTGRNVRSMREKGLEPLSLAAPDPKSGVSASFTTLARNIAENVGMVNNIPADRRFAFRALFEPWRDRTSDPQIKSLLLYQLS
jgi:hypothetical protein